MNLLLIWRADPAILAAIRACPGPARPKSKAPTSTKYKNRLNIQQLKHLSQQGFSISRIAK
jgi:hypothetical protein